MAGAVKKIETRIGRDGAEQTKRTRKGMGAADAERETERAGELSRSFREETQGRGEEGARRRGRCDRGAVESAGFEEGNLISLRWRLRNSSSLAMETDYVITISANESRLVVGRTTHSLRNAKLWVDAKLSCMAS